MWMSSRSAWKVRAICASTTLLGASLGCSNPIGPSPAAPVPPTPTVTITGAVTISPARLQASVNDFSGLRGRYVINPMVTFSASAIPVERVKYIRFAFVVDADRVIKEGAIPVDGGDLRQGPVTQQYPLTFDVPVHFPNLRVQITATFVDGSGAEMKMPPAEAVIQLPGVLP